MATYIAEIYDTSLYDAALAALGINPNGAGPKCDHVDGIRPVTPQSARCQDCRDGETGRTDQLDLLVCLTCGWVACSNDSPRKHAQAHSRETEHPIAGGLQPGSEWRWCYVHAHVV